MTSLWRRMIAAADRALTWLPRQPRAIAIAPARGLLPTGEAGGYLVFQADPVFTVTDRAGMIEAGWYLVAGNLRQHTGCGYAVLSDPECADQTHLPIYLNGDFCEVALLAQPAASLDLRLVSGKGVIELRRFAMSAIGTPERWLRLLHRVVSQTWREQGTFRSVLAQGRTCRDGASLHAAYKSATKSLAVSRVVDDYQDFLAREFLPKPVRASAKDFFSVVIIDDVNKDHLYRTLESIRKNDFSNIDVIYLFENYNISEYNDLVAKLDIGGDFRKLNWHGLDHLLSNVRGEWIVFLFPGDVIRDNCFSVSYPYLTGKNYPLVYADHDSLDPSGVRTNPHFKPDWSFELFKSVDYIKNAAFYNKKSISGFNIDEGEDIEKLPRVLQKKIADSDNLEDIGHIRHVLFHLNKSERSIILPRVSDTDISKYNPVEIIIPNKNKPELLRNCIDSITKLTRYENYNICIIDNDSDDPRVFDLYENWKKRPNIRVIEFTEEFNYSKMNNRAVQTSDADIIVLLNNDTEILSPDWLCELVRYAARPEIGAVGAKLLYPSGLVQHVGVVLGIGGVAGHVEKYIEDSDPGYCDRARVVHDISAVTGACLALRRELYSFVGGLEEDNLRIALNDIDLCVRIRNLGYTNILNPNAKLIHHESLSRGKDDTPRKKAIFRQEFNFMKRRHGADLQDDPYFNPNLGLDTETIGFARQFRGASFRARPIRPRIVPLPGGDRRRPAAEARP